MLKNGFCKKKFAGEFCEDCDRVSKNSFKQVTEKSLERSDEARTSIRTESNIKALIS